MDLLRFRTPNAADLGVFSRCRPDVLCQDENFKHWEPTRPKTSKFKCLASKVNIAKYIYICRSIYIYLYLYVCIYVSINVCTSTAHNSQCLDLWKMITMVPSLVPFSMTCTTNNQTFFSFLCIMYCGDSTNQDVHRTHQYRNTKHRPKHVANGRTNPFRKVYANLILNWWKLFLGKRQTRILHESDCRWRWRTLPNINHWHHKVNCKYSRPISIPISKPDLPNGVCSLAKLCMLQYIPSLSRKRTWIPISLFVYLLELSCNDNCQVTKSLACSIRALRFIVV